MRRSSAVSPAAFGLALSLVLSACSLSSVGTGEPGPEPEGRVEPGMLDFGLVEVGDAPAVLELTVTSTKADLTIEDVAIDGPDAARFAASPRAAVVPEDGSGTIEVTFTPVAESEASATLTLTTSSKATPTLTVALAGRSYVPNVRIEPTSIDFGDVVLGGTPVHRQVKVTNDGTGPAEVRLVSIRPAGAFVAELPSTAVDGAVRLGPAESARVDVVFRPTARGAAQALLTLEPCDVCDPAALSLEGNALATGLDVGPDVLDFGAVNPGSTVTRPITFRNVGNEQLRITDAQMEGDAAFSMAEGEIPVTLEPGGEASLAVSYSPNDLGAHTATVTWASTDPNRASGRVVTVGTGGGPDIRVTPATLDFGPVALATSLEHQVVVTNVGHADLHLSGLEIRDSTAFAVAAPADLTVPVDGEAVVTVAYAPTAAGDAAGRLVIASDDADALEVTIDLAGRGLDLPPCDLEPTPTSLDFGLSPKGEQRALYLALRNVGTGTCLVSDLRLTADTDSTFTLPDGPLDGLLLDAGQTRLVPVGFRPTAIEASTGALRFYVSDPSASVVEVPLTGAGSDAKILVAPDDVDLGPVTVGCASASREVCLYNLSSKTVNLLSLHLVEPGGAGDFLVQNVPAGVGQLGAAVQAGAAACFTVAYRPQAAGFDTAAIYATFQQYAAPFVVTLKGTGAADAVQTDRFVQLDNHEADVLFVIENSGGQMGFILGSYIDPFFQFAATEGIDYHFAVTTTDCTTATNPDVGIPNTPGLFWPQTEPPPRPRVVTPDLPDPEGTLAQNLVVGDKGDSAREAGLEGAYRALSAPLIDDPAKNGGFLRPDASLAIVFVAEEEDQSMRSTDFYLDFFRSIHGARNPGRFTASALIEGPPCGIGGERYADLQARSGGVFWSFCDFITGLANVAPVALGLRTRFFPSSTPVAEGLQVRIRHADGTTVDASDWTYDAESGALDFGPSGLPEVGDTLEVTYPVACN